jgi:hypothetical protein
MADDLANTLLMRILDHERAMQMQQRMEEQASLQGFADFERAQSERSDKEFERQLKLAEFEGRSAQALGRPGPQFDDPRLARMAGAGRTMSDIQQMKDQQAAAALLSKQQREDAIRREKFGGEVAMQGLKGRQAMQRARVPLAVEKFRQTAQPTPHTSYQPRGAGGGGGGSPAVESFLNEAGKLQMGWARMKAELTEQFAIPENRARHDTTDTSGYRAPHDF